MFAYYIFRAPQRNYVCLMVRHTWENDTWYCGYSELDTEIMTNWWGNNNWRAGDVLEYGLNSGAFHDWYLIGENYITEDEAEKVGRDFISKTYMKKS